MKDQGRRRIW